MKEELTKNRKGFVHLEKHVQLLETFLEEYKTTHDIKDVVVYSDYQNCTLAVVNRDDERDVKFGVKWPFPYLIGSESVDDFFNRPIEVYGEYMFEKDNYPKTTEFLESINPKK